MKTITKYQTRDGAEFADPIKAEHRERLLAQIDSIMRPLGTVPMEVERGKGWVHHDLETVNVAKDRIIELCREEGLAKSFDVFGNRGRDIHPLSIAGRILNDHGGPLDGAWSRFARIDEYGREHQQPYFAYTAGPSPEHVCIEDRRRLDSPRSA